MCADAIAGVLHALIVSLQMAKAKCRLFMASCITTRNEFQKPVKVVILSLAACPAARPVSHSQCTESEDHHRSGLGDWGGVTM